MFHVISLTDFDLGAARFDTRHQRQEAVRRAAGDDVDGAGFLKRAKAVQDVPPVAILEHLAGGAEMVEVHVRRRVHGF